MSKRKYSTACIMLWLIYPLILFFTITFMFFTCSNRNMKTKKDAPVTENIPGRKEFRMPAIPEGLSIPSQRADYLAEHYWDHFDFSDTVYANLPEITEQAFADYLNVLPHSDKLKVYLSIGSMLGRAIQEDATGKMYIYFLGLYKNYLYNPNSPMRDDEYYIPVTNYILEDTVSDGATKERAKFDLSMMKKNRIGQPAADFGYSLASGKTNTLHGIKSDYTLLMFYNPDCYACGETVAYLKQSQLVNTRLQEGRLKVLAFYPDGDLSVWKKHLSNIPATWINSYDKEQSVRNKLLYDLKAIPTLYLLDREKRVLLKDVDAGSIEKYLSSLEPEIDIKESMYR